jgi:hypothetical protein
MVTANPELVVCGVGGVDAVISKPYNPKEALNK